MTQIRNWQNYNPTQYPLYPPPNIILYSLQAKNGFYIFKLLKKAEKNISWYVESIWKSHLSVHKGLGNTTTPLAYRLPIRKSVYTTGKSWVVVPETTWPTNPKIFTIWLFTKFVNPCSMGLYSFLVSLNETYWIRHFYSSLLQVSIVNYFSLL